MGDATRHPRQDRNSSGRRGGDNGRSGFPIHGSDNEGQTWHIGLHAPQNMEGGRRGENSEETRMKQRGLTPQGEWGRPGGCDRMRIRPARTRE